MTNFLVEIFMWFNTGNRAWDDLSEGWRFILLFGSLLFLLVYLSLSPLHVLLPIVVYRTPYLLQCAIQHQNYLERTYGPGGY